MEEVTTGTVPMEGRLFPLRIQQRSSLIFPETTLTVSGEEAREKLAGQEVLRVRVFFLILLIMTFIQGKELIPPDGR